MRRPQGPQGRPMIQFSLRCSNDHRFESWFQSSEAYDKLERSGLITCTVCGASTVSKAVMAPRVRPARNAVSAAEPAATPAAPDGIQTPANPVEQAIAAIRRHIESTSD